VGLSEIDITPPLGIAMSGHWTARTAREIRDPLFARALILDDGKASLCLITVDVLSVQRGTVLRCREAIEQATGIPADRIAISATHTHYGPLVARIWTRDLRPDPDYLAELEAGIVRAATVAWERRQPGQIAIGWAFEGKLSFNRRFMMRSGEVVMHPPVASTDILYQEGKTDPEVGVISVRDADGEPLGWWVNFACHATVAAQSEAISADFPGELSLEMKRRHGDGTVTLFGNGCCGNLCQIDVFDADRPTRGEPILREIAEGLAGAVERAEEQARFTDDVLLDARSVEVQIPLRHVDREVERAARELLADEEYDENDPVQYKEHTYARMIIELVEEKRDRPLTPGEVQAMRIGDVALVMLPGEIFVEHGLTIKLQSPAARTFVVELANGIVGYVPTREAFEGGGYEQRLGNNSKLSPVAGELMTETALALLGSMFR
ncbi:MAG: neutral/alkaline non-lysosomal ceramidase N-terminal domain-containing protein, partial [Armatimonadota bacterium]